MIPFEQDDGGRAAAGFRGTTGDCVTRAIAIAAQRDYREVYDALHEAALSDAAYMRPPGRLVVRLSKHVAAVVDGVLHDTYDCSRGGTRCVYGYWRAP
jgi:hypothetical protein